MGSSRILVALVLSLAVAITSVNAGRASTSSRWSYKAAGVTCSDIQGSPNTMPTNGVPVVFECLDGSWTGMGPFTLSSSLDANAVSSCVAYTTTVLLCDPILPLPSPATPGVIFSLHSPAFNGTLATITVSVTDPSPANPGSLTTVPQSGSLGLRTVVELTFKNALYFASEVMGRAYGQTAWCKWRPRSSYFQTNTQKALWTPAVQLGNSNFSALCATPTVDATDPRLKGCEGLDKTGLCTYDLYLAQYNGFDTQPAGVSATFSLTPEVVLSAGPLYGSKLSARVMNFTGKGFVKDKLGGVEYRLTVDGRSYEVKVVNATFLTATKPAAAKAFASELTLYKVQGTNTAQLWSGSFYYYDVFFTKFSPTIITCGDAPTVSVNGSFDPYATYVCRWLSKNGSHVVASSTATSVTKMLVQCVAPGHISFPHSTNTTFELLEGTNCTKGVCSAVPKSRGFPLTFQWNPVDYTVIIIVLCVVTPLVLGAPMALCVHNWMNNRKKGYQKL